LRHRGQAEQLKVAQLCLRPVSCVGHVPEAADPWSFHFSKRWADGGLSDIRPEPRFCACLDGTDLGPAVRIAVADKSPKLAEALPAALNGL
jgi:hypothetical protein